MKSAQTSSLIWSSLTSHSSLDAESLAELDTPDEVSLQYFFEGPWSEASVEQTKKMATVSQTLPLTKSLNTQSYIEG